MYVCTVMYPRRKKKHVMHSFVVRTRDEMRVRFFTSVFLQTSKKEKEKEKENKVEV